LVDLAKAMNKFSKIAVSPALRFQWTLGTSRNVFQQKNSLSRSSSTQPPGADEKVIDEHDDFPNLMMPDQALDAHEEKVFPPTRDYPFQNRVIVRNDGQPLFLSDPTESGEVDESSAESDSQGGISPLSNLPLSSRELKNLYRFPLLTRRITQQTGKGKIHRQYCMMVVGNGDGLVGLGEGKDEDLPRATDKAFAQAVRNMDWVERFEKRTIWTEIETKLGATRIILRPRPVGFGLRCNPNIHQVLKAAGIKDISAKVWGSRNPMNVIKALFRMLQAGNAPLSMGDGIGGSARKLNKGSGVRGKSEVERDRGRKLIDLRD
jgi:small subunit ribosomal protein S5